VSGKNPRYALLAVAVFWAVILCIHTDIALAIEMPNPAAHWKLNESNGMIAEDSIGDQTGSLQGNPKWQPDGGRIGGTLHFNGITDYVDCGNDPIFNIEEQITISAWIKVNLFNKQWQAIITKGDTAWRLHRWNDDHSSLSWNCNGLDGLDNGKLRGYIPVDDGQWHHVAGVYDGTMMYLYVDGVLDNFGPATGLIDTNTEPVYIGENSERTNRHWNGWIDDLRVYNIALTREQILFLAHPTFHVDIVNGNDTQEGSSRPLAYATIQKAIDKSLDQDTILIWPGVYQESNKEVINFMGKGITVQSAADAAILESPNNFAVVFQTVEQNNSVLRNVVIRSSSGGIYSLFSSPTLKNITVVQNEIGLEAYGSLAPVIRNSIFWDNQPNGDLSYETDPNILYTCIEDGFDGLGNLNENPLFADSVNPNEALRDYHLRSERGRFVPDYPGAEEGIWVLDDQTSPCVDAGETLTNPMAERMPNGGRINMGAYGNTYFASMNEWPLKGDINRNGVVNILDYGLGMQDWLKEMPWYE